MNQTDEYWLHKPSKQAIGYLNDYHNNWSSWANSPYRQAWVRNFVAYYSPVLVPGSWDTSLVFQGVQGELIRFFTPKARTLIRNLVTITTQHPLAFQAMAETDGSDVIQELKYANAYVEQTLDIEKCDMKGEELVELALVTGAAFIETTWRTDKGIPYTRTPEGGIVYTGHVGISIESVFNVFYDVGVKDWQDLSWVEIRTQMNRWDLIAQFPDLKEKIMAISSVTDDIWADTWFNKTYRDVDQIFVFKMYAKPSPALPQGRMIIYSDHDTVYYDDKNPYECIPVEAMIPEKVMNTGLGYPIFTNLIAPQEMYDNSLSAWATNEAAFAVQSVTIPRGAGINVNEMGGMRFISFLPQNVPGGGKPEALQLNSTANSTKEFSKALDEIMQDLSQVSGALRGNPPPGVTSGVALATLATNALEFIGGITKSYYKCWTASMNHAVNQFKTFGKIGQPVHMKGANSQIFSSKISGSDLQKISGIKLIQTNPLMKTIAGRIEIAEKLLQMPREIWPQYVSVLEGRPLTDIYKGDLSEEDLIKSENDMLSQGKQVLTLATDDHPKHVQMHAALLNDQNVRQNNPYVQNILAHMKEHEMLAQSTDPFLTAMVRTGKMPQMPAAGPSPSGGPQPQMTKNEGLPKPGVPLAEPATHAANPAKDLLNRQGPPPAQG